MDFLISFHSVSIFNFRDIIVPKSSYSDSKTNKGEMKSIESEEDVFYDTEEDPDEDSDDEGNFSSS